MIVALTGSTGFLGRYLVPRLLANGHQVVAVVRPTNRVHSAPWLSLSGVRVVEVQVEDRAGLVKAFGGCDAVVHALAALSGDAQTQHAMTVRGTANVLAAMSTAGVRKLVGISSLSVYHWDSLNTGDVLDESTPLETHPEQRDTYARCKLQQDEMFTAFGQSSGQAAVVLRPGIFYGPGSEPADRLGLWGFALGHGWGANRWCVMGPLAGAGAVPLVHVADVAQGVQDALTHLAQPAVVSGVLVANLVETPAATRHQLIQALNQHAPVRRLFVFPWGLHWLLARGLHGLTGVWPGLRARLPGLLRPTALWARFAPVHFTSFHANQVLGWYPRHQVLEALSVESQAPATPDMP